MIERHPPALPRGRRRHHRDQHLRRHEHHAERVLRRRPARARRPQRPRLLPAHHRRPFLNDLAWEINEVSREQCARWPTGRPTRRRQRFVAGAIGPLTVSLSNSPDADDAGFRVVTFDQVKAAYAARCAPSSRAGRPAAGRDHLRLAQRQGRPRRHRGGVRRGQHLAAHHDLGGRRPRRRDHDLRADRRGVVERRAHVKPLAIGLNCSLGPDLMYPHLAELAAKSTTASSRATPTPACPTRSPRRASTSSPRHGRFLGEFADAGLVNIAGGCCGNTPEHIAAIAKALEGRHPREIAAPRGPHAGAGGRCGGHDRCGRCACRDRSPSRSSRAAS
jgi:5-methyltetrahydrofolate--homocysteine methyltransferase